MRQLVGLVLAGGIAITLGAVVSAAAWAVVLGSGLKIAMDERNLSQYQLNRDNLYQELRSKMSTEIKNIFNRMPNNTGFDRLHEPVRGSSHSSQSVEDTSHEETSVPFVNPSSPIPETEGKPQFDFAEETQPPKPTGPK